MNNISSKNQRNFHSQEFTSKISNNNARNTKKLFNQKTPRPRKSKFFKITSIIAIIVVLILLYKSFASSIVGTATNISLDYDTNTIKLVDGKLQCIEDDRIFQWHKGLQMWECKKPTSSVFGELDKNNVKVNDSGNLECKEDGKVLYWDKDQWNCGDASNTNFILTENGLELDKNKISIDSPTCNENEKLIWNGSNFICEEDKDEDKQTLSFKDNVLSILNGNTIDLNNLDNSKDLNDHIYDDSIHFKESDIDHNNIKNNGTNTHSQIDTHIADSILHFTEGSINHGNISGLSDDDHTQYALLDGRSGGQTLIGGNASGNDLTLNSNSLNDGNVNIGTKASFVESDKHLILGDTSFVQPYTTFTAQGNTALIVRQPKSTATTSPYAAVVLSSNQTDTTDGNIAQFSFMNEAEPSDLKRTAYILNKTDGALNSGSLTLSAFLNGNPNTNQVVLRSNGNIGFNTNNPTAKNHIKGSTSDSSAYALKVDDSSDSSLLSVRNDGVVGIGTLTPNAKLDVNGGIKIANDSDTCDNTKVGTLRYRSDSNNSYVDMCMQDGASSYNWTNIKTNNW